MKKGFTLIELLAVIVILAIIALIAVPIVLNIIDETKSNATLRSADFYLNAVELSVAQSVLKNQNVPDGTYNILESGNICLEYENTTCKDELKVEVNGEHPKEGTITIKNGNIADILIRIDDKNIVKNDRGELVFITPACKIISGNINTWGSEISCGDELFYIIPQDTTNHTDASENTISMLAKYNLNIGTSKFANEKTYGIQDQNVIGRDFVSNKNTYGNMQFSSSWYWNADTTEETLVLVEKYGSSIPAFIYDNNSNLYEHVEAYEDYLIELGVSSASATLMSHIQAETLGCQYDNGSCLAEVSSDWGVNPSTNPAPEWVYSTSYWLGSACSDYRCMYNVSNDGTFSTAYHYNVYENASSGIRPVIIINKLEIN